MASMASAADLPLPSVGSIFLVLDDMGLFSDLATCNLAACGRDDAAGAGARDCDCGFDCFTFFFFRMIKCLPEWVGGIRVSDNCVHWFVGSALRRRIAARCEYPIHRSGWSPRLPGAAGRLRSGRRR